VATWAREAGYPRLWAGVWDWNTASRRVLEKLGFHEDRVTTHDLHSGNNILTVLELSA
jgi:RimJ/RimL family protein N-acetyltransferase